MLKIIYLEDSVLIEIGEQAFIWFLKNAKHGEPIGSSATNCQDYVKGSIYYLGWTTKLFKGKYSIIKKNVNTSKEAVNVCIEYVNRYVRN